MPKWQILVVRSGQPETLLEASKAWTWEQRLSARVSFSLVYHAMLNDLMKGGQPNRVYSQDFAGVAVRGFAWRTGNDVCLYVSSVSFNGALPPADSCEGLDALAYEAFDQTSVAVITRVGKTWIFEQTQGDPILSPLLITDEGVDTPDGFSDAAGKSDFACGPIRPEGRADRPDSQAGSASDILNAAWLDAWRLGGGSFKAQLPVPVAKLNSPRPMSSEDD